MVKLVNNFLHFFHITKDDKRQKYNQFVDQVKNRPYMQNRLKPGPDLVKWQTEINNLCLQLQKERDSTSCFNFFNNKELKDYKINRLRELSRSFDMDTLKENAHKILIERDDATKGWRSRTRKLLRAIDQAPLPIPAPVKRKQL